MVNNSFLTMIEFTCSDTCIISNAHLSLQTEQRLRKAVSDIASQIDRYKELEDLSSIDEDTEEAECECCGLKEDYTQHYITKVKGSHSGKWLCGLCCEAVKETLERVPKTAIEEAVNSHREFCQNFNSNRLNPKLSLTSAMRDVARRISENRNANNLSNSKLARSTSCVPRIDLN